MQVVDHQWRLSQKLEQLSSRIIRAIRYRIQCKKDDYNRLVSSRGFLDTESRLNMMVQRLDELELRLNSAPLQMFGPRKSDLKQLERALPISMDHYLVRISSGWQNLDGKLKAFSPLSVLERGYSIVTAVGTGAVVRDPSQIEKGDLVSITVAKGSFPARRE